jgi:drug/metabolite transporter (DMT)-like permease
MIASASAPGRSTSLVDKFKSPVLALTLATLFWAGNFIVGRALRGHIDPVSLNLTRWLIALVLFAPLIWRETSQSIAAVRREWLYIFGLGATGIAAFHTMTYLALQTTTATNALLVLSFGPIAILGAAAITGVERPNRNQVFGMLVSVAGAIVLVTRGNLQIIRDGTSSAGDLWILAAVAVWAVYSLLLRRRPADLPPNVALGASMAAGVVLMFPFLIFGPAHEVSAFASLPLLLGLGYIAIFASIIAFLFYSFGVARLGASRSGQFLNLMPVFGVILAFTFLGETPGPAQIAGAVLVVAGILLVERARTPA